jgi:hypothetical protein
MFAASCRAIVLSMTAARRACAAASASIAAVSLPLVAIALMSDVALASVSFFSAPVARSCLFNVAVDVSVAALKLGNGRHLDRREFGLKTKNGRRATIRVIRDRTKLPVNIRINAVGYNYVNAIVGTDIQSPAP